MLAHILCDFELMRNFSKIVLCKSELSLHIILEYWLYSLEYLLYQTEIWLNLYQVQIFTGQCKVKCPVLFVIFCSSYYLMCIQEVAYFVMLEIVKSKTFFFSV